MEVERRHVERCQKDPTHLMVWRCQECEALVVVRRNYLEKMEEDSRRLARFLRSTIRHSWSRTTLTPGGVVMTTKTDPTAPHPVCPHCAAVGAEREREEFVQLATRALSLDRTPCQPTGGMQTGDMLVVGMSDWFRLTRLARWIVRARGEGDGDG